MSLTHPIGPVRYIDDTSLRAPDNDRFSRAFAGAGSVEVGEHVGGPLLEGPPQGDDLGQGGRDTRAQRVDQLLHQYPAAGAVRLQVRAALVPDRGGPMSTPSKTRRPSTPPTAEHERDETAAAWSRLHSSSSSLLDGRRAKAAVRNLVMTSTSAQLITVLPRRITRHVLPHAPLADTPGGTAARLVRPARRVPQVERSSGRTTQPADLEPARVVDTEVQRAVAGAHRCGAVLVASWARARRGASKVDHVRSLAGSRRERSERRLALAGEVCAIPSTATSAVAPDAVGASRCTAEAASAGAPVHLCQVDQQL